MGQEPQRRKDEDATGRDRPNADGQVSTEDVNAINDKGSGKETGQDHSLDNYGETMPDDGVAAVQKRFDTTSGVARVEDESGSR
jgi:hypothetical protein